MNPARHTSATSRAQISVTSASRQTYTAGLAAIDRYAHSSRGAAFTQLSKVDQDSLLIDVETGAATGFTASSLASVSLAPPLVSFGVDRTAGSAPAVCRAPAFAVNLLGADQAELAARFARRGADRFGPPTRWEPGPDGLPLLTDALGHLVCRRHRVLALGDHWLVVGLVTAFGTGEGSAAGPLLYHDRRYGGFTERRAG